ncbi:MAG TPA: MarR family transcriptional regulator [Fimbriimonadaceae bacterium]|nr:MarR family transcriptional regulator [Fimbriimonadaceae bacterium]
MKVQDEAARLESLLPQVISILFHSGEADPLRHHTVGQIRLMRTLLTGSKTASELSQRLGLSPSSLTQMVGRMVRAGLVAKGLDPEDRRVRMLSLTPAGRELMENRQGLRIRKAKTVLERMDPNEVRAFIELLEQIRCLQPEPVVLAEAVV